MRTLFNHVVSVEPQCRSVSYQSTFILVLSKDNTNSINLSLRTTMESSAAVSKEAGLDTSSSDKASPEIISPTCTANHEPALPNEDTLTAIQSQLDALESMRRANLELELGACANHDRCTFCQREEKAVMIESLAAGMNNSENNSESSTTNNNSVKSENVISAKLKDWKIDGHRIRSLDGRRIRGLSKRFLSRSTNDAMDETCDAGQIDAVGNCISNDANDQTNDIVNEPSGQIAENADANDEETDTSNNTNEQSRLHLAESCPARIDQQPSDLSSSTNTKSRRLLQRKPPNCLTCGHPTCAKHISTTFSTHHIQICNECAYLFELDFLVDVIDRARSCLPTSENIHDGNSDASNPHNTDNNNMQICQQKVNSMIECYDRAKLLLTHTSLYAPQISTALQSRTDKSNRLGVTANASGILSGITGIVGAGALLCPPVAAAGLPILVASLVFGGTATAVHTTDYAVVKYWSEPNALADRMVVLHGMCLSLLRVVEVLSFGLLNEGSGFGEEELNDVGDDSNKCNSNEANDNKDEPNHSPNTDDNNDQDTTADVSTSRQALTKDIQSLLQKHGVNTTSAKESLTSSTPLTGRNIANRHTRYLGRVGTTAAASMRFVPLAGGVLSAASLVVEANEIKATLAKMNEGTPCEKSERVREIAEEVDRLPEAEVIAGECRRVFEEAEERRKSAVGSAAGTTIADIGTGAGLTALENDAFDRVVEKEMTAV